MPDETRHGDHADRRALPVGSDPAVGDRRWPACYALLTAWIRPATTTARTARVPLPRAFGMHVLALFVTVLAGFMIGTFDEVRRAGDLAAASDELIKLVGFFAEQVARNPKEIALFSGILFLAVEGVFFILALATAPFGARDERLRDSLRHALRRTWLHTPHVPVAVLLAGLAIVELQHGELHWRRDINTQYVQLHPAPTPPSDTTDPIVTAQYHKRVSRHWSQRWRYVRSQHHPWYFAFADEIGLQIASAVALWFLWALYRGVSAPRAVPPREHEPLCRSCGYNLTALPIAGRCSECGAAVVDTMGLNATPGAPWEHRGTLGRFRAYLATFAAAIRQPADLGRRLALDAPRSHALRFLAVNLALCVLIACAAVMCESRFWTGARSFFWPEPPFVQRLLQTTFAVYWIGLLILLVVGLIALLIALHIRAREKRNVLPWIGQLIAYGSAYFVLWITASSLLYFALEFRHAEWLWLAEVTGLSAGSMRAFMWTIPNAIAAIGYLVHSFRGARGVRYAWR